MEKILEQKSPLLAEELKGIGQIMLQENSWTGLLFIIGIFINSLEMGIAILVATLVGTITARLLKYDKKEIGAGLYGFSPALVGVALTFLFQGTVLVWLLIVVGASLACMLQHFFIKKNFPAFTFPFVLVSWVLTFCLHTFTDTPPSEILQVPVDLSNIDPFTAETNGFGEVIFQGNILSGLLFFVAVFISSPIAALYGLAASGISEAIAILYNEPIHDVHLGLFSFNAVLCAIVFSGNKKRDGIWVLLSVILSVIIDIFLVDAQWTVLTKAGGIFTFPFVLSTWIILFIKKRLTPPADVGNTPDQQ